MHRGLLSHHSSYFRAALNGPFQEAATGEVVLKDEESRIFEVFNTWLYTGKVTQEVDGVDTACEWYQLTRLYVFADKRGIPRLKNAVVNDIVNKPHKKTGIHSQVDYVYSNTPVKSLLRKLLVDILIWKLDIQTSKVFGNDKTCRQDFLLDIIRALDLRPTPKNIADAPFRKNLKGYYEDEDVQTTDGQEG